MKILVGMGHPGHVHHFKYVIRKLEKDGFDIKIVTQDKDVSIALLKAYRFTYENLGENYNNLIQKVFKLIKNDYKIFKIAKKFKPDLIISRGSPYFAHISRIINKPHIAFCDTEHAKLNDILAFPFTDAIMTPNSYQRDLGNKQIKYPGYHELAYLHPDYFTPDPTILDDLGFIKDDCIIIVRFVDWNATHDLGQKPLTLEMKWWFIKELEKYGRVLISSESELPSEFKPYQITLPPEKLHDLLFYADLFIGQSGTMATESALLGIPSIHISYPAAIELGNFVELEKKYGLVYNFIDANVALEYAIKLLKNSNLKKEWRDKKEKLLKDKIDVTAFMVWFIENYPESFTILKKNPNYEEWIN